jgi:hypothetical protein
MKMYLFLYDNFRKCLICFDMTALAGLTFFLPFVSIKRFTNKEKKFLNLISIPFIY